MLNHNTFIAVLMFYIGIYDGGYNFNLWFETTNKWFAKHRCCLSRVYNGDNGINREVHTMQR